MRKKFFMALLLAALVIVLAACNRGDDTDENGYENGSVVGGGTDAHELHGIFERDGVPANWVPGPEWTRAHVLANMPEFTPTGSVNWADGTTATINMLYGWDNIAVNARARRLMWEYNNTMESNMDREFFPNPMVTQNIVTQSDQYFPGTRTYTFTIYTENQWSDGR
ncbi:MAG: hypothetical protein FWE44_05670, partial [Defluviitaleaceae bacterium]|nr:hypothetical protein [Defluviitaleaceae bacterium]